MKVLFDHHSPFILSHGGFQIQIEQTRLALINLGVDVSWLKFWDDTQKPDIIHYFGPCPRFYMEFAKAKGVCVVVNELHTGLGSHPRWKHQIQKYVIGVSKTFFPQVALRLGWDRFNYADAIMALTPYEADLMCDIFHADRRKMVVIPNGVEDVFLETSTVEREDWLLCTAAIHPRKRVLELAQAAIIAQIPVHFYGKPYSEKDEYFILFLDTIKKSDGLLKWGGSLDDRNALADIYRRAKGFVLASTMESLSLSALEAAATRCPLLLSRLPWATETFGENATYLTNTDDTEMIAANLLEFYRSPNALLDYKVESWKEVALRLKALYERITVKSN